MRFPIDILWRTILTVIATGLACAGYGLVTSAIANATSTDERLPADARPWWSFQPVEDPPIPQVKARQWPRDNLDRFILAKLEHANMQPAPPADARTLIRRVYFDLIGLPPPPDAIARFLEAASRDAHRAWGRLVDRLLASTHYGQRWGRHWT